MFDIKRRYQNVENALSNGRNSDGCSRRSESSMREEKITQIKHNVKNIHILAYFVIAILISLYTFRMISNHLHRNPEQGKTLQDVVQEDVDPTFSFYNFDLSYFSGVFNDQQKRSSRSNLPELLASSGDLCDFDRFSDETLTPEKFLSQYRTLNPFILFFYQDLEGWSFGSAWHYANMNESFRDLIVQFGRSVDSDYDLRETTFSNFLNKLIGQTDLRGEPWQIRDPDLVNRNSKKLVKDIKFFPELWKSKRSALQMGTTLSATGFTLNSDGPTLMGVVKGRTRVFMYPASTTPPAGYDHETDMLSWFTMIYPDVAQSASLKPFECIIEAGEILFIPEAWFWAAINIGTTTKVLFYGEKPQTAVGQKLAALKSSESEIDPNDGQHLEKQLQSWGGIESLLPGSEFVRYEEGKLLVKLGRTQEALQKFESLGRLFIRGHVEAARLFYQVSGNWEDSLKMLNDTLQKVPNSDIVLREMANLLHDNGEYENAGDYFGKAALLSSQIEQQLEDLAHAEENYDMTELSVESKAKKTQIENWRLHFKHIAHNEYTAFKN